MPYKYSWPDTADLRHSACIVLGCHEPAIACCYTRHGRTAYCTSHDPIRLGMVRPYQYPATRPDAAPLATASTRNDTTAGPMAPVRPIVPPTPPPAPEGARMPRPVAPVALEF